MDLRQINESQKKEYNRLVNHAIQSWEWGEFRKSLGLPLLRYGIYRDGKLVTAFQLTLHKIPFTNFFVGYLPKGPFPDKEFVQALKEIGKKHSCAFIKIEPNVQCSKLEKTLKLSPKPYFTKYNYILDLTKSEEQLLKNMHPKFRYNIKVAQKHGVVVEERYDEEALEDYLKLYFETTNRQGFLGHNQNYHRQVWKILKKAGIAKLLIAYYQPPTTNHRVPLTAWMLLHFQDTLYYPYGGSSTEYKNVMASNLVAWYAIRLGKKLKAKSFDLWGAGDPKLGEDDPYKGFTQFKSKLGATQVEYIGTYDLVFNPLVYCLFTFIDKASSLKVFLLKLLRKS